MHSYLNNNNNNNNTNNTFLKIGFIVLMFMQKNIILNAINLKTKSSWLHEHDFVDVAQYSLWYAIKEGILFYLQEEKTKAK